MNRFTKFNRAINETEGTIVNILTALSPWLAPIIPAYMVFDHLVKHLEFAIILSLTAAAVIEIQGFGTVSTGLDFWFFNKSKAGKAKANKAPFGTVVISFVFYLSLILLSNVVLDISTAFGTDDQQAWAIIAVRFLLTLQTIPAALIVAARTGHRDIINTMANSKTNSSKVSETFRNLPKDWRTLLPTLDDKDIIQLSKLSPEQMKAKAHSHGITERTVLSWKKNALKIINDNHSTT